MGRIVNGPERHARFLLRWYPRTWRATHEEEFLSLLEDTIADRRLSPRRHANVVMNGLRVRSIEFRNSRRRARVLGPAAIIVFIMFVVVATNGFDTFPAPGPTKGAMPYEPHRTVPYNTLPDFLAVYVGPGTVGYTPKAYLTAPNGAFNTPLLGSVAPVYASNLTTLLGHEYPGVGFVPLGRSPWAEQCHPERAVERSASRTITRRFPCPSATFVLPRVDGMVTPTAVGKLSGLGVSVVIHDVHSSSIPPGHVVSTLPLGGATVHARQQVIVNIAT